MTYKVGSRHEGYGETGMAHLLEHLVFQGSPRHRNIPQELTELAFAPERLHLVQPHELFRDLQQPKNLRWALDLESDYHGELFHRQG